MQIECILHVQGEEEIWNLTTLIMHFVLTVLKTHSTVNFKINTSKIEFGNAEV